jgi:hypothetical protein
MGPTGQDSHAQLTRLARTAWSSRKNGLVVSQERLGRLARTAKLTKLVVSGLSYILARLVVSASLANRIAVLSLVVSQRVASIGNSDRCIMRVARLDALLPKSTARQMRTGSFLFFDGFVSVL